MQTSLYNHVCEKTGGSLGVILWNFTIHIRESYKEEPGTSKRVKMKTLIQQGEQDKYKKARDHWMKEGC